MLSSYKITFSGRVQGVGFRPFVTEMAKKMGLTGYVSNNEDGVIIMLTGAKEKVEDFYRSLLENPPPVSRITSHFIDEVDLVLYDSFGIKPSSASGKLNLALTPDFGICDACSSEISDPQNKRFRYPFTTCVNCGPRWSITNAFPFDRHQTTMAEFSMCEDCKTEYENVHDRRFHSQTNSCEKCGIQIHLKDHQGALIETTRDTIFKNVNELLRAGKIIAIKNTGGYLLCCDATNAGIIQKLRHLKRRPNKPFAILYPNIELLEEQLQINAVQRKELLSVERPIVIVSNGNFKGSLAIEALAPGLHQLGIMLPYTGILELLSKELDQPIVATSGNIHGSPIISNENEAFDLIAGIADYFLQHNLIISNAQDDSVVKYSDRYQDRVMFRRSRGFAPNYLEYAGKTLESILALGGHLKSTISFIPNDYLYISQYLGNLDHYQVYQRFQETAENFVQIFDQQPDLILVDKHPAYLSSQYGGELSKEYDIPLYKIQHHKAHFASVLGENDLMDEKQGVLGVIWDGTGYGDDGHIWGGEFFTFSQGIMERTGYFEYFDWLAGDKMSKEPRLSLFSLNSDPRASFLYDKFTEEERKIYTSIKKLNKLKTSSVGRLFDALASLLDICNINTYEGEAPILLENAISDYDLKTLRAYTKVEKHQMVSTSELWDSMYKDFCSGTAKNKIILNFLFTLAEVVIDMAKLNGLTKIAMSGGVFQNTVLIDMIRALAPKEFELFFNLNLAPNDENISFGQLMYYLNLRTFKDQQSSSKESEINRHER